MMFDYSAYKENYFQLGGGFKNETFFTLLEDNYDTSSAKKMYIKNILNEAKWEMVLFYDDKIVTGTRIENRYIFRENRKRIVDKRLICGKLKGHHAQLTLVFEDGEQFVLCSEQDANKKMQHDYTNAIKALYKML